MKGGNPQRVYKMNIGYTAANGKSTEMDMHEAVFPIYTYELDNTFFSKTCTKRHKFGARLVECPIRLAYINELDDGKLDGKFFKKFGDCKNLPLEKMYDTMTDNSRIQSKLITTSNIDPNINFDPGTSRRTLIQKYESQFVAKSKVDESKHRYLMDTYWVDTRFSQDAYKLAYFHFLLSAPELVESQYEANRQLVAEQVAENDDFLSKLEEQFTITENESDRVTKFELQQHFPDMPTRELNNHLKRFSKSIVYDKLGSKDINLNGRGVYKGIRKYTQKESQERETGAELLIDDPE